MNSWIDDLHPGCGPLIHAAQNFAAKQGFISDPPRGVTALAALARAIDQQADRQCEAEEDRRFVEQAGAFFAVVLAQHLGVASHAELDGQHRLRLGAHGFFDPFAGVARVLEAEDTLSALSSEIALAEAEARSDGPVGRIVKEVERQLGRRSTYRIARHFDRNLWLGGSGSEVEVELDLSRVVEATRGETDSTVEHAVTGLLSALGDGVDQGLSWDEVRERLLPRLVGPTFLKGLQARDARQSLYSEQVAEGLQLCLLVRHSRRTRFVRSDECAGWPADPRQTAINNLARLSDSARLVHVELDDGPMVLARSGDGLDAARLLLPGLHDVLEEHLGSPFVAAVPHRDALFACPSDPDGSLASLWERTVEEAARAPHAISDQLYLVHPGGRITIYDP